MFILLKRAAESLGQARLGEHCIRNNGRAAALSARHSAGGGLCLSRRSRRRRESISRGAETYEHGDDTENIKNLERSSLSSALALSNYSPMASRASSMRKFNIEKQRSSLSAMNRYFMIGVLF